MVCVRTAIAAGLTGHWWALGIALIRFAHCFDGIQIKPSCEPYPPLHVKPQVRIRMGQSEVYSLVNSLWPNTPGIPHAR